MHTGDLQTVRKRLIQLRTLHQSVSRAQRLFQCHGVFPALYNGFCFLLQYAYVHALLRCHAVSEALHKGCVCVILVRNSMGDGHQCGNCNHIRAHTLSLRFLLSLPVPHSLSHCHSLTLAPCLSRTPMRSQSETLGDSNAYQCDKCNHKAIVPQKSAL